MVQSCEQREGLNLILPGYQPKKRSSVPCSASPQEAIGAYLKVLRRSKEEREQSEKKRKDLQTQSEEGLFYDKYVQIFCFGVYNRYK